ncbi:hypothetical protein [Actinomadura harenae]|uniref:Uncharacterized protein n=1 Tax=Actinomadura harenae TaxID=2483351 RepID=A0A3M2M2J2_9ACTN|nr:hypothetical protein [Actinomadura harenae]RMI43964.1 hypothetical protein EBO15_14820 [Actinomadura harenae]
MIPQLVTVGYRRSGGRRRRIHLPVLPVALLLSPLLLLAVLGGLVACAVFRIAPMGALRGTGSVLWALPGTFFEVEEGSMAFLVSVR